LPIATAGPGRIKLKDEPPAPANQGSRNKDISTTIITTTAPIISEVESGVFKKLLSLSLRIF